MHFEEFNDLISVHDVADEEEAILFPSLHHLLRVNLRLRILM